MWYDEFGSIFFITITTLVFGSVAMCVQYALKSKCENVDCGCLGFRLNIQRNVLVEEDIELGHPRVVDPPIV
jgi:hypothetical protein